ncbi:MAG: class I SAM-dependent methyltransferase, partial [Chloroflexota bacterium]
QLSGYQWVAGRFTRLDGLVVLDVACGEGFGADLLAKRGAQVWAVDLDLSALRRARSRYGRPAVRFMAMDAAHLAFAPERFDLVISQDTLEHVQDDKRFVGELHRILRPGGHLILMTPAAPVHTTRPQNPFHLREYSVESLRELLAAHFQKVQLFGRRPTPILAQVESAMNRLRRFDPFGVRRWVIPTAFRHRLASWLCRQHGLPALSAAHADLVEYFEGTEGSGTLIVRCRRER